MIIRYKNFDDSANTQTFLILPTYKIFFKSICRFIFKLFQEWSLGKAGWLSTGSKWSREQGRASKMVILTTDSRCSMSGVKRSKWSSAGRWSAIWRIIGALTWWEEGLISCKRNVIGLIKHLRAYNVFLYY